MAGIMCYPVKCRTCGKTRWAGCGQHVDEVMSTIPAAQQCSCRPDPVSGDMSIANATIPAINRPHNNALRYSSLYQRDSS
jgi:hypothetical protein